ncbi:MULTISPECIES: molybdate ABC transporter permease subunit [Salimicrobium]|uniref:Molybdenum transport system permease n=2 Tax=Salimicrobium TaxID=351195 RepID=A0ABY1KX65_9BACI|nr:MULTISPECIES: molybdate ABC transporter permease subunit [Salimicrobium]SDX87245.1 molybdate transport system permease protein [Salimicrobium album]SIS88607.1 molybdate transport system permease protein [Salimicrobium salexigens]
MEEWWSPVGLSLRVSILSTLLVIITGTWAAFRMKKTAWKRRSWVEPFFMLPMVLPPTVLGFGLVYLFGRNGPLGQVLGLVDMHIYFSLSGAVLASAVVSFPLMYQSAKAAFQKVDDGYIHAARTLGTSEKKIFFSVILPLAWPGLAAGGLLSFARGIGEFGATLMIAGYIPGRTDTLPIAIYFAVETGEWEKAFGWTALLLVLGVTVIFTLNRITPGEGER